jgi:hypothetical protein
MIRDTTLSVRVDRGISRAVAAAAIAKHMRSSECLREAVWLALAVHRFIPSGMNDLSPDALSDDLGAGGGVMTDEINGTAGFAPPNEWGKTKPSKIHANDLEKAPASDDELGGRL